MIFLFKKKQRYNKNLILFIHPMKKFDEKFGFY